MSNFIRSAINDGYEKTNDNGDPLTRKEIITSRRGAFKWLPVLCSNDLVHGSWWFVWGSVGATVFAIIPLVLSKNASETDDTLNNLDYDLTWGLLIFSGIWFTIGSLVFVRAFEEPPKRPLLYMYKNFQTDELLAAWLFLIGTVPAVPYTLVYFLVDPNATYMGATACSGTMVMGTVVFVMACYPTEKRHENVVLPFMVKWFGERRWILRHLANDWLAGTWFFLIANGVLTVGAFGMLCIAFSSNDPKAMFVWLSSFVNSLLFFIGSFYYVSGSYPHDNLFHYTRDTFNPDGAASPGTRRRRVTYANDDEESSPQHIAISGGSIFNPVRRASISASGDEGQPPNEPNQNESNDLNSMVNPLQDGASSSSGRSSNVKTMKSDGPVTMSTLKKRMSVLDWSDDEDEGDKKVPQAPQRPPTPPPVSEKKGIPRAPQRPPTPPPLANNEVNKYHDPFGDDLDDSDEDII